MILDPITSLREALESEALDAFDHSGGPSGNEAESARRAALAVAVALGHCRLYGLDPGEDDGTLDPALATAAARMMADRLDRSAERAGVLDDLMEEAGTGIAMSSLVEGLLETAMDAWAVFFAVSETADEAADREEWPGAMMEALDRLHYSRRNYDTALKQQLDGLCFATDSGILEFWRSVLAEPYSEALPWWLDGTLERHAEELEEEVISWGPDEEVLRAFRRQVLPGLIPPFGVDLLPVEQPALLAAAEARPAPKPDQVLDWIDPEQELRARLRLPGGSTSEPEARLVVRFISSDLERVATELAGKVAMLAGLPATIDEQGRASWGLGAIRDAGRNLDLEVQGQLWVPMNEGER